MKVKERWTESEFSEMGWHDSCIHSIHFPTVNAQLVLDIDYLFDWKLNDKTGFYSFWVSPCILTFQSVSNLKIELFLANNVGLYIQDILRTKTISLQNRETALWEYVIKTEYGNLTFDASGFEQIVINQPIFSESQVLDRISLQLRKG